MSNYSEKMELLRNLREQATKGEDAVYKCKINLLQEQAILQQLMKEAGPTTPVKSTPENQEMSSSIEEKLKQLNEQINRLDLLNLEILAGEQNLLYINKRIILLNTTSTELEHKIGKKQNPHEKERLLEKHSQLKQELLELQTGLSQSQVELDKQINAVKQNQEERDRLETEKKIILSEAVRIRQSAVNPHPDNTRIDSQKAKVAKLEAECAATEKRAAADKSKLQSEIGNIYISDAGLPQLHPKVFLNQLSDATPFLFFPLRLETRFIGQQLLLRVYPDDIFIHTHEKTLTEKEVESGKNYWIEIFNAENSSEAEELKKQAWQKITTQFGASRAAWVARTMIPSNWSNTPSNAEELSFTTQEATAPNAWSRAPRAKILPDKFVVLLYSGDKVAKEIVGNLVPDTLFMGPDPLDAEGSFVETDGKLHFGNNFDWMADFEKAVNLGMAFRIDLNADQVSKGFDKILITGLFLSADAAESQQSLEELIDNHHYSPKGIRLLSQGTPTNNTAQSDSGFTQEDPFSNISYFVETGPPLFDQNTDCDGRNLADALGINYDPLQYVQNADGVDSKDAREMNAALYPGTLGYYAQTLLKPVLTDDTQQLLRDFFVNNVSGRGPLPSIAVGKQPYGILVTSDFERWKWERREPTYGTPFLSGLYKMLKHYSTIWESLLPQLQFVGKTGQDPAATLINILGLQPGSVDFRQRIGYSSDYLQNLDAFKYGGKYYKDVSKNYTQKNELLNFFKTFGYPPAGKELEVPQLLRLIYQHYTTGLDAGNIISHIPLSEKDLLPNYDEAAQKNYLHWLAESNSIETLEKENFGTGKKAPDALLYLMLRRALLLQLHQSSVKWFSKFKFPVENTLYATNFYNIRPQPDLTKYEVLRAKVGTVDTSNDKKTMAIADYLLLPEHTASEGEFLKEVKSALASLAQKPTATLERCLTEHLDTLTYRFDSWQTAIFNQRLQKQRRTASQNESGTTKGIYLGAYGWLENIRPAAKKTVTKNDIPEKLKPTDEALMYEFSNNGGYVHAPTLNHASAAAVLRGGYLAHATPANPGMMSVNLSSERVRRGMFILDGMRNGQTLEALLGYQFERGLHDRASENNALMLLNRYIYDFRLAYPILQHQLQQQGTSEVQESIPSNNVVNGVALAEKTGGFPFGASGAVTSASAEEKAAIEAEKNKLADTLDAIKDLLLSESVYQMVQGNFERSGAVLNSLKDVHLPPELDVINSSDSSLFTYMNRVSIHFEDLDPDLLINNPWGMIAMTPRARMEAGVNKWLGEIIGNPQSVLFRISHIDQDNNEVASTTASLAMLNLQPIDLIYILGKELNTGNDQQNKEALTAASEFENRIAFAFRQSAGLSDSDRVKIEFSKPDDPGNKTLGQLFPLLANLKSLLTDSRPLDASDYAPPTKKDTSEIANPKGYDPVNLLSRIQQAQLTLTTYKNNLEGIAINASLLLHDGSTAIYSNLKDTFDGLETEKSAVTELDFTLGATEVSQINNLLLPLSNFGIQDTFPKAINVVDQAAKTVMLEQALGVRKRILAALKTAADKISEASTLPGTDKIIEKYIEAGKAIFGDLFTVIPLWSFTNPADIQQANADQAQLLKHATAQLGMDFPADEWLHGLAYVRPKVARWELIRTLAEANATATLEIKPVQLPFRAKDNWLAVEFPEVDELTGKPFTLTQDTISVVVNGINTFDTSKKQGGILIDDWTEKIPVKEEVTGIAFNYNQPNATPPQALLLAVTPEEKGHWEWEDIIGILNDTLKRAKLRAVEPLLLDKVNKAEVNVLLPAIISEFSSHDLNISLDYRRNIKIYADMVNALPAIQ